MSYQERAYFTHNTLGYTDGIRISLLQKDYNGTSRELRTDANPFEFEYDEQPSLTEWFMPSAVTAYFKVDTQQLLDDLVNAQEEEFMLEYRVGLTAYWRGFVRNGLIQAQETTLPITVSITAIDGISLLKNRFLSKTVPEQTTIKAILDSLLGSYDLSADGWDSLELRQLSSDVSKSIFELANVNRDIFYEGDDQDQQPVSQYFFLEQILKRFSARLYYYNGWKIETIDSEKSWITTKTVTPKSFLKDLISTYLPARKTLQLAYKHNAGNKLFSVEAGTVYDANGYSQTISYSPTGDDKLTIDGYVSTQQDQFTAYSDENQFYFDIALTTGTHYWDRATRRWRAGSNANSISIFDPPRVGSSPIFGRYRLEVDSPPTGTTQLTLSISSIIRRSPATTAASVNFNFSVAYNAGSVVQGDTQVLYAQNEDQAFDAFDLGELIIGDGLGVQTAGAITYSNGDPTRNWRNAKSDASPSFYEPLNKLNLRTILGYQKSPRKVLRGTLAVKDYHPYQLISYEGKLYRFSGGNLTGEGRWQGTWIELRYENPDVTFTEYAEDIPDFNTLNFSDISQTLLEVKEVLGSVTVTDIQTDLLVEWENIQVILKDGTRFAVDDGVFKYHPYTAQEMVNPPVRVFYYDKPNNAIVHKTYDDWISSDEFFDSINYAELFRLTRNKLTSPDDAAPKTDVDVAPIAKALFSDEKANGGATTDELFTFLRNTVISITGEHLLDDVSVIKLDPNFPLRVDLPAGAHLLLVSGKSGPQVETARAAKVGALEIEIRPQFLTLEKGAKILFDNAYYQAQLFVQPNRVLITANEAKTEAEAAVRLINDQSRVVAELFAEVYGDNNTQYAGIKAEIDRIKNNSSLLLKTDNNGVISGINLVSGELTSDIKFKADNFLFEGSTTFTSAINQAIINNEVDIPNIEVFRQPSTNAPTDPKTGDRWYQTDKANLVFTFDATIGENGDWIRSFTNIDEGFLTTGILSAQYLKIDKKLTIQSGGSFVMGDDTAVDPNYSIIDNGGYRAYKGGVLKVSLPSDGSTALLNGVFGSDGLSEIVGNLKIRDGGALEFVDSANQTTASFSPNSIRLQNILVDPRGFIVDSGDSIYTGYYFKDKMMYLSNDFLMELSPRNMYMADIRQGSFNYCSLTPSANGYWLADGWSGKLRSASGVNGFNGTIPSGVSINVEHGVITGHN